MNGNGTGAKWLAVVVAVVLAWLVGVPMVMMMATAAVLAPAVAEEVREVPCSAFTGQINIDVTDTEESGVGFELPKWGSPRYQSLHTPAQSIPARIKTLYVAAGKRYGLPWQLLAGIGMAETRHGRNNRTSSAGAQGLMQFMPATFRAYGVDGDGDGKKDIHSDTDSIYSAAHYLVSMGVLHGAQGVLKALWAYNHSLTYRNDVLFYAWSYAGKAGPVVVAGDQEDCGDGSGDGDPNIPPLTSARIAALFAWAETKKGLPYVWGGNGGKDGGYDCSGFVHAGLAHIGINAPRTALSIREWVARNGYRVKPSEVRPGDLGFAPGRNGPIGHVYFVYNPAKHTSWESASHGVGIYHYTRFAGSSVYQFWRIGNLSSST